MGMIEVETNDGIPCCMCFCSLSWYRDTWGNSCPVVNWLRHSLSHFNIVLFSLSLIFP